MKSKAAVVALCIQWHPEAMLVASDDMLPVFTGLIEAAKKAADK